MNIGIFTDTYTPQINGVATSISILENELRNLGHNVYIITTTDAQAKKNSQNVIRLKSMPFVFMPRSRVALLYSPRVAMMVKRLNLDIIHTHTEFALGFFGKLLSKQFKIPLVHTYHTMWEEYVHYIARGHLISKSFAKRYSRFFCHRALVVVTPTLKSKELLKSYGVSRPIKVIPTGINFAPFLQKNTDIQDTRAEFGLTLDDIVITFIGRIAKEKNIDIIIKSMGEVFEKSPKTKLVIVGDGPARAELTEISKKMGFEDRIIFAGFRPWAEISKYYQMADYFISASETETQGLTYIEAIASKIPIIAKYDDAIKDIIKHKQTGFLFHDSNSIAQTILEALNSSDNTTITENAFKQIEHLSSENFGKNMSELYKKVISAYPKRR